MHFHFLWATKCIKWSASIAYLLGEEKGVAASEFGFIIEHDAPETILDALFAFPRVSIADGKWKFSFYL